MQGLSFLVLFGAYLAFWAVFWIGLGAWVDAQSLRVADALNASARQWSCALMDDVGRSGWLVVRFPASLPGCAAVGWRPEVVRRVS